MTSGTRFSTTRCRCESPVDLRPSPRHHGRDRQGARVRAKRDRGDLATAAAIYELIVIGEAVGALPEDVLVSSEHVPKRAIVGMRNLAAHEYHRVSDDFVWGTVDVDLPVLRDVVVAELERLAC